jgi:hypothetical protein
MKFEIKDDGYSYQVDPTDGMTSLDFQTIAYRFFGVLLSSTRIGGGQSPLMYFFNLWHETMKQNRKCSQSYDFNAYMTFVQGAQ